MKKLNFLLLTAIMILSGILSSLTTRGASGFKNPVLAGFHADPSVCRVGDDFYLGASRILCLQDSMQIQAYVGWVMISIS